MRLQKLIAILAAVWMAAFCYGLERDTMDVLIPYRLNGKIGFVNQNLEKITEAKYTGCRDVTRYFALVYLKDYWNILLCDGQETRIGKTERMGVGPAAIGDEYVAVPELIPGKDKERFKTTIFSVFDGEVAVVYDWKIEKGTSLEYMYAYDFSISDVYYEYNYIDAKGEIKFPEEHGFTIESYDEDLGRGTAYFQEVQKKQHAIIDEDSNIIKRFSDLSEKFSDGLIAGIDEYEYRDLEKGEIPGGYYDRDGNLRIPVIFHKSEIKTIYFTQNFNSGVLPCWILDGEIHVMGEYDCNGDDWGIIDTEGNIVASHITAQKIEEFSNGVANIITENQEGKEEVRLINTKGEIITEEAFDEIADCINGYCMAQKNGEDYLISAADGTVYRCRDF